MIVGDHFFLLDTLNQGFVEGASSLVFGEEKLGFEGLAENRGLHQGRGPVEIDHRNIFVHIPDSPDAGILEDPIAGLDAVPTPVDRPFLLLQEFLLGQLFTVEVPSLGTISTDDRRTVFTMKLAILVPALGPVLGDDFPGRLGHVASPVDS